MLPEREDGFLAAVIEAAQHYGWKVHHTRAAWSAKGYRTPVQGDRGFCDLVMAKTGHPLLICELKGQGGRLSDDQRAWLEVLMSGSTYTAGVWRPSDWNRIIVQLKGMGGT